MPRSPTPGVPRYRIVCRDASRLATAARAATVLPAPHSPVMTPIWRSATHQPILATASRWAVWVCSIPGARSLPKGIRANP
jgi:hypothetical protein